MSHNAPTMALEYRDPYYAGNQHGPMALPRPGMAYARIGIILKGWLLGARSAAIFRRDGQYKSTG